MARKKRTRANGEGAPYRRTDGRWCASYWVTDSAGARRRRDVYGTSRQEVLEKRRAKQAAHDRGELVAGPRNDRGTVGRWLDDWLALKDGAVADTTWQQYEREVRLHLKPELGHLQLERLKPSHVQRLLNGKRREGLSDQTVRHVYNRLHCALADALRDGLVARNVADAVDAPSVRSGRAETFTGQELAAVIAEARAEPLYPLFVLAARTGLRSGELLGLRWQDVDLESSAIHVRQVLRRTGTVAPPKSDAGSRTIVLTADATALLGAHRAEQARDRLAAGASWEDHGLVFPTSTGRPLSYRNVLRSWYRAQARAGLTRENGRRRGLHSLRKVYATTLVAGGVPINAAQRLMGHSRPDLTLQVYAGLEESALADAAQRSSDAFARMTGGSSL